MSISFARTAPLGLAAALLVTFASPTFAHVTLAEGQATSGTSYKGVLKVPHGCGEAATTAIKVGIPEGVVSVKPQPKAGWTLALEKGPYEKSYDVMHGKAVKEGVKTITWSGGNLPNAYYDEFVFIAYLAPQAQATTLYFPVLQSCEGASTDWAQIPQQGGPRPEYPAPALKLAAAAMPATAAATFKAGTLTIEQPWARATPGGAKVAGGYVKITNTGPLPDKLIGGSFERAGRFEVHEMGMNNGVMTMRPVSGGLDIAPGASVMLAPGGFHIMLMDLKQPLKEGESVKGTLTFEKAGTVDVVFAVRGIGAGAPTGGGMGSMEHQH
ncbi:MAG TPA: DUF1775 domain-containing protein [Xanthobacteraceae bacterium]|jgi:uncharacterized protein YcnI|nr:DUF1775 domain-containing protein [Xanthobacteraceae bacterium]HQS46854.1 DUF1775 domain-containing protein [Xanthobacteraceae bacterium]